MTQFKRVIRQRTKKEGDSLEEWMLESGERMIEFDNKVIKESGQENGMIECDIG